MAEHEHGTAERYRVGPCPEVPGTPEGQRCASCREAWRLYRREGRQGAQDGPGDGPAPEDAGGEGGRLAALWAAEDTQAAADASAGLAGLAEGQAAAGAGPCGHPWHWAGSHTVLLDPLCAVKSSSPGATGRGRERAEAARAAEAAAAEARKQARREAAGKAGPTRDERRAIKVRQGEVGRIIGDLLSLIGPERFPRDQDTEGFYREQGAKLASELAVFAEDTERAVSLADLDEIGAELEDFASSAGYQNVARVAMSIAEGLNRRAAQQREAAEQLAWQKQQRKERKAVEAAGARQAREAAREQRAIEAPPGDRAAPVPSAHRPGPTVTLNQTLLDMMGRQQGAEHIKAATIARQGTCEVSPHRMSGGLAATRLYGHMVEQATAPRAGRDFFPRGVPREPGPRVIDGGGPVVRSCAKCSPKAVEMLARRGVPRAEIGYQLLGQE